MNRISVDLRLLKKQSPLFFRYSTESIIEHRYNKTINCYKIGSLGSRCLNTTEHSQNKACFNNINTPLTLINSQCHFIPLALKKNVQFDFNLINVKARHNSSSVEATQSTSALPFWLDSKSAETVDVLASNMVITLDFVTEEEEGSLVAEIEPRLKRLRYEFDHWDDAIHGYREIERVDWSAGSSAILKRVRDVAFSSSEGQLPHVHILDLAKAGHIKPHVDSVRYCGDTITGISLLSASVMRLINVDNNNMTADVLLPRRSLYIMKGIARYKFTHEILDEKTSYFKGELVPKDRRVSVICRNQPTEEQSENS